MSINNVNLQHAYLIKCKKMLRLINSSCGLKKDKEVSIKRKNFGLPQLKDTKDAYKG
jgi:hypothetical protein